MRLVHHEQAGGRRELGQHLVAEVRVVEPLRADQEYVDLAAATSAWTVSHSSVFEELIVRARMPARAAASTWLRISASSGETITVGPLPRSRSSEVATKYTADLPQPVRWTTSARRPAMSASMARHWSSRSRASPVGSPTRRARTASASVRGSVVLVWFMPPYNRTGLTSGPPRAPRAVATA